MTRHYCTFHGRVRPHAAAPQAGSPPPPFSIHRDGVPKHVRHTKSYISQIFFFLYRRHLSSVTFWSFQSSLGNVAGGGRGLV